MDEENFAFKLIDKQLRRSEYHFTLYALYFLFLCCLLICGRLFQKSSKH